MKRRQRVGAYTVWENNDGSLSVADPRGYFIYPHADLLTALLACLTVTQLRTGMSALAAVHDALLDYDTDRDTDADTDSEQPVVVVPPPAVVQPSLPFDEGGLAGGWMTRK